MNPLAFGMMEINHTIIIIHFLTFVVTLFADIHEKYQPKVRDDEKDDFAKDIKKCSERLGNLFNKNKIVKSKFVEANISSDLSIFLEALKDILSEITEEIENSFEEYAHFIYGSKTTFNSKLILFEDLMLEISGTWINKNKRIDQEFEAFCDAIRKLSPKRAISRVGYIKSGSHHLFENQIVEKIDDPNSKRKSTINKVDLDRQMNLRGSIVYNKFLKDSEKCGKKTMINILNRNVISEGVFVNLYGLEMKEESWVSLVRQKELLRSNPEYLTLIDDNNVGVNALIEANTGYNRYVNMEFISDSMEFFSKIIRNREGMCQFRIFRRISDYKTFFSSDFLNNYIRKDYEDDLENDIEKLIAIMKMYKAYLYIEEINANFTDINRELQTVNKIHKRENEENGKKISFRILSKRN